jgi:hypothetical protein
MELIISKGWKLLTIVVTQLFLHGLGFAQNCAMCYSNTAASDDVGLHAIKAGIVFLMVPPTLCFIVLVWVAAHSKERTPERWTRALRSEDRTARPWIGRLRGYCLRARPESFLLGAGILFMACLPMHSATHYGEGFSVELKRPYTQVLAVAQEIAQDGQIRGTRQYKDETELTGAVLSADAGRSSLRYQGRGKVLYKVKKDVLAPQHFHRANGKGSVTVRYVVEQVADGRTRLSISAAFDEDDQHEPHPSDGSVESSEYSAMNTEFIAFDKTDAERAQHLASNTKVEGSETERAHVSSVDRLPGQESSVAAKPASPVQAEEKVSTLRVSTEHAELKVGPQRAARTLISLNRGDSLTLLLATPYWYQVETQKGEQGWVYHLLLEVQQ